VQPDLARTLQLYAEKGSPGFYRGRVADAIVREIARGRVPHEEKGGAIGDGTGAGWITRDDLTSYKVKERTPLKGWFKGLEIVTMPPPSSGGIVLLQALGILEGLPLDTDRIETLAAHAIEKEKGAPTSTDTPGLSERMVHWWIEALRAAFARSRGDDGRSRLRQGADRRAHVAGVDRRTPHRDRRERARRRRAVEAPAHEGGETTHISVLDEDGNACSLTTTLNTTFGSKTLVEGAGFFLNDEMDDFAVFAGSPNEYGLVGGVANAIQPKKRPLSSMMPTVLRDGGHANVMVIGSPGGPRIITAITQVLLRMLVLEQSLDEAGARAALPPAVESEGDSVREGLRPADRRRARQSRGHPVSFATGRFASVQAIVLTTVGGTPVTSAIRAAAGSGGVQGKKPSQPASPAESTGAP
jgi:gamma-glutamyltranspeptidase/glutathione hydrolase